MMKSVWGVCAFSVDRLFGMDDMPNVIAKKTAVSIECLGCGETIRLTADGHKIRFRVQSAKKLTDKRSAQPAPSVCGQDLNPFQGSFVDFRIKIGNTQRNGKPGGGIPNKNPAIRIKNAIAQPFADGLRGHLHIVANADNIGGGIYFRKDINSGEHIFFVKSGRDNLFQIVQKPKVSDCFAAFIRRLKFTMVKDFYMSGFLEKSVFPKSRRACDAGVLQIIFLGDIVRHIHVSF